MHIGGAAFSCCYFFCVANWPCVLPVCLAAMLFCNVKLLFHFFADDFVPLRTDGDVVYDKSVPRI